MTSVSTDSLHVALDTLWETSGLNWEFKKRWPAAKRDRFLSLYDDTPAAGSQSPYAVFTIEPPFNLIRMRHESDPTKQRESRDHMLTIRVHVLSDVSNPTGKDLKEIAAELQQLILGVFGGHPTQKPQRMALENACHDLTQYQNDFPMRTDEGESVMWTFTYLVRIDVPVQIK